MKDEQFTQILRAINNVRDDLKEFKDEMNRRWEENDRRWRENDKKWEANQQQLEKINKTEHLLKTLHYIRSPYIFINM